ncbi:hypothetical protein J132_08388 [Termitomyces sp. J132]|nr:hypothetical protein J132_08388 [Termitomyces sp. J132]
MRVDMVILNVWIDSTSSHYASAVQDFLNFCKEQGIPFLSAVPASEDILSLYAASMAGILVGCMAANKILGQIRRNRINGPLRISYTLRGTENLRPPNSVRAQRCAMTRQMLHIIYENLDMTTALDTCIWAIILTAFWSQIRLGECLPKRQSVVNPKLIPSWRNFACPNDMGSRTLHLPHTKRGKMKGETAIITRQHGSLDPIHARMNEAHAGDAIAVYKGPKNTRIALVTRKLLKRINPILENASYPTISGHCFCIGGTTALLLDGVPPDIVKLLSRWSSDSFLRY